jgi:UDP-GlcNAc:undecaprenyl-phosphate GlcNAc-1-phosphate transferase
MVSILLGAIDDFRHIPWQVKLTVQLILTAYIATIFWDSFNIITFYNYSFPVTPIFLLAIFLFWFVGVYNAVNLLDGLDGLASGFMVLVCICAASAGNEAFALLNFVLALLLIGFLVFNQRPAKLFMGDAGSLFLGFHIAVMPLLFVKSLPFSTTLNTTPFVLLASYLVADTTRVFFSRMIDKKNPMTADTIHFHHVILQESGSYLVSIGSIFIVTLITSLFSFLSFFNLLSVNFMLGHLALLLFFILMPPIQTYVPLLTRLVKPFYSWQSDHETKSPFLPRTIFIVFLLIGMLASLFFYCDIFRVFQWQNILGILLLLAFVLFYPKDKMVTYVIQLGLVILIAEVTWGAKIGTFTKLFSILLFVSYIIFIVEERLGSDIRKFSALDLLMILFTIGGIVLSNLGFSFSIWFSLILFSIWFGLGFVLCRTAYFTSTATH